MRDVDRESPFASPLGLGQQNAAHLKGRRTITHKARLETEQALTALAGFGCDVAQGYHLSRRISAAAFDQWYARPAPALLR
jgi:EAL domain-containing protein (putative c-di-GMP-specific phosphodiesterase class I)